MLVAFVSSLRQREQRVYESTVGSRVSTIMFIFVSAEFVLRKIFCCVEYFIRGEKQVFWELLDVCDCT